ncbi:MAG: hypothetical protein ABR915_11655, partial [Thermoguttaceae bacterium]
MFRTVVVSLLIGPHFQEDRAGASRRRGLGCGQPRGLMLLLGLTFSLSAWPGSAAERKFYDCTLQQALSGPRDVVLMFAVEGGQLREQAAAIVGDPRATCRIKEHALKVEGGRLSGPMQIQTDAATEKIELNVTLDKGGTYAVAYGLRKAEGKATVEAPEGEAGKRRVVWLVDAMRPGAPLGLMFNVDRRAKTFEALPARAETY